MVALPPVAPAGPTLAKLCSDTVFFLEVLYGFLMISNDLYGFNMF